VSSCDVVLRGGRVVDPESGLDAVCDVAVAGDRVAEVGAGLLPGRAEVDVTGLVVTAGFVDLHSHVNDIAGLRLQALDGVTTALELEAGVTPVSPAYRNAAAQGRPVNYGLPSSLTYAPTGERVANAARLRELRGADPGGLAIIDLLDEDDPADRALLLRSLTFPGTIVASDAMPVTWTEPHGDPRAWPLPRTAITHPRTAGTFSRALRLLTRGDGTFGLARALRRCSLEPARLLEAHVPGMRRKGRLRAGSDADVVVFDPDVITDRASYADSTRPSAGIRHVLVNGTFVVRDGRIAIGAGPGRPVRARPR